MGLLYKLRSFGYAEIEDDIWFPNLYFNALVKMKKSTGRIEIVDRFPNYGVEKSFLYSTVYYAYKYLIFIPNESEEITSYHIETKKFESVALDSKLIGTKKTYFANAYVYKHYVYMFPTGAQCIVKYDILKHTIKYLDNCISALIREMPETSYCFYQQFEVLDEKIYLPFLEQNAVAIFDVSEEKAEIRYLNIDGGCSTINYIDGFFYLASWNKREIYRWNSETGEIKVYCGFPENIKGGHTFLCAYDIQDTIIFFPEQSDIIMFFSAKTGEMREVRKIYNHDSEVIKSFFVRKGRQECSVLTTDMEYINEMVYKDGKLYFKPCFYIDDLYNKKQITDFIIKQGYRGNIVEAGNVLQDYIGTIKNTERKLQKEKSNTYGEYIFKEIKKELEQNQ